MRSIRVLHREISRPSIWHSRVTYMLGGMGSLLALIFFALIILACSYWNTPNTHSQDNGNSNSDPNFDEKNEMMKNVLYCSGDDKGRK
ncbi:hypothetical protein SUGI_0894930 [Cryptomeria japonica]|nr:hypothetical protein SUGI_0894930 [Cryptomeria japonica]